MEFWQSPSQMQSSARNGYMLSAQPPPEQQFSGTLLSIYDQPGYGEAFAALTRATQQVRIQRGKKNPALNK
jgi:hypothetical protein